MAWIILACWGFYSGVFYYCGVTSPPNQFNKGRGMKKLKVEYAMKELDIHWHAGLDEDLKEKTVKEIFALLMPSAGSKQGDKKKGIRFQFGKLKKDH